MLCPKLLQWLIQKLQTTRNFCGKNKFGTINTSLHVLPWLSCQDLAMIMTSVPCIMICHDLEKVTIVNHDLARFAMIMARVPWLRTLGSYTITLKTNLLHITSRLIFNISTDTMKCPNYLKNSSFVVLVAEIFTQSF